MPVDTGRITHRDEFHRGHAWKRPCVVATTANVTISTALNTGDTIDGIVLGVGDRVLVKDQTTGAQNGIYVVGPTPARDFDMDADDEVLGALVYVIAGGVNGGKVFRCTDTTVGVLDTTAIAFVEIGSAAAPTTADYLVGTAQAGLSAEIVVGTTPGGELGGTWPSPTVDASHSGSTHAATQAAAEATAAAALGAYIAGSGGDHEHIWNLMFSGDGATTAFELPAAPFDQFSVAAYVAGVRTDVTLSGALFTTMTFGSAPAAAADNIIVDLVAVAV